MEKFLCLLKIVGRPLLIVTAVFTLPIWLPMAASSIVGVAVVVVVLAGMNDCIPWANSPKKFYWWSTGGVLLAVLVVCVSAFNPYYDSEVLDLRKLVRPEYWFRWAVPNPWFLFQVFLGAVLTSYVGFFWHLEWNKTPLFFTPIPDEKKVLVTDPH